MHLRLWCLLVIVAAANSVLIRRKPGTCPLSLDVGICDMTCYGDVHCPGEKKCCMTTCGGSLCIRPALPRNRVIPNRETPGYCPNPATTPWVCSNRCALDSDCREGRKCCKNRCGALACVKYVSWNDNELY